LEETLSLDGVGDDEDRHVGGRLHFEFPGQVVEGARPLLGVASQVKRLPERRSVEEVHASPLSRSARKICTAIRSPFRLNRTSALINRKGAVKA